MTTRLQRWREFRLEAERLRDAWSEAARQASIEARQARNRKAREEEENLPGTKAPYRELVRRSEESARWWAAHSGGPED